MKHSSSKQARPTWRRSLRPATAILIALGLTSLVAGAGSPPVVPISQVPLTIQVPANPQIVWAIANSQSMDGTLSGAIMTGSGMYASSGYSQLNNSSSPVNFVIPAGFAPPLSSGDGVNAPYTVVSGGNYVDNSPSRLNMAKAGITAVLNQYIQSADFAMVDYATSGLSFYQTWVYYMSPDTANFTFTNVVPAGSRSVANPCYQYAGGTSVTGSCDALTAYYSGQGQDVKNSRYMIIGASSDDPAINDVLYAGGLSPVCMVYGGPSPGNPYTNFTLGAYENGWVYEAYNSEVNGCAPWTGPTNAGYVPYAPQTYYALRGYGFYTFGETANNGAVVVPMTSAGATPTTASVTAALNQFAPYLAPETSSTGTVELKAAATQSPIAGLLLGAKNYLATNPPSSNGCNPTRYVVLVTDGLPTMDLQGYNWPPLGTISSAGYGVTASFNGDGSLGATNDQALIDTINTLAALKAAGVKTYIIGLGAGVDPTVNPMAAQTLTSMAVAGGTKAYFPATSAVALAADLQVILSQILAQTQATSSAAVSSTALNTTTKVYQSEFVTSDANLDWTGELYAFPINPTTGQVDTTPAAAAWSAKTQLQLFGNWDTGRRIATWDPTAKIGIPFRWNVPFKTSAGIAASGLSTALQSFPADPNGQDMLQFLRGSTAQEQKNGGAFRNRTWKLGDIVHSAPLYVGAPAGATVSPAYQAFEAMWANRPSMIYVGANDGMLHGFDAATGLERFAFIPNGVWNNLPQLANPYYNQQHRFFVDGSPVSSDVQFDDGHWHTVLIGSEGAGGSTIFALDVTDPAGLSANEGALASAVLWEFSDATDLGLTFSQPVPALTNSGWLTFFGNGYDSASSKAVLYALDTGSGAVVAKLDLCAKVAGVCDATKANGLSSPIVVNSSGEYGQAANLVYAGDLQGNLWKIDISNAAPSAWVASVILQATDPTTGARQPITVAPNASLNARYPSVLGTMVFIGTGQLLGAGDLSSTQIQSVYGVYDPPAGFAAPQTRATLIQQTLSSGVIGGVAVRYVTGNTVTVPTQHGWFVDLGISPGERVVTDPQIIAGGALVLTTYLPNGSFCTGGGYSWLMVLNYATGGSFPAPQFDVNGDGAINGSDSGPSGNPVGLYLGNVYASAPDILGGNFGNSGANNMLEITDSNTKDKAVAATGTSQHRISWWEVR